MQRDWNRTAPLVRHVGLAPTPHRPVAHAEGARRWRQEGLKAPCATLLLPRDLFASFDRFQRKLRSMGNGMKHRAKNKQESKPNKGQNHLFSFPRFDFASSRPPFRVDVYIYISSCHFHSLSMSFPKAKRKEKKVNSSLRVPQTLREIDYLLKNRFPFAHFLLVQICHLDVTLHIYIGPTCSSPPVLSLHIPHSFRAVSCSLSASYT